MNKLYISKQFYAYAYINEYVKLTQIYIVLPVFDISYFLL